MKKSFIIILIFLSAQNIFSQGGIRVDNLPSWEAEKYVKPLATYLGTYFNTGTYHSADVADFFGFKFNIVGMFTLIPESQRTFKADPRVEGGDALNETATVFGNKGEYYLSNNGFVIYPSGLGLKTVTLGIYQISGSLFGTELMLRYFPTLKFKDIKAGLFGFGLKHEVSRYFPLLPLDISVQLLYNTLLIENKTNDPSDYVKFNSKNFAFNLHASKSIGVLILYGGLQYESSGLDVSYYFKDPDGIYPSLANKVYDISVDGDNHFRFTVGSALKLAFFVLNVDANITSQTTYSLGMSFEF
ncbi:Hypothetical protein IALB_0136 [Ignavibacterium album JCM 16511]|uniref:Uncharacterized protein n=1 Tax=Ignavibacterium album (strain DSM 19864 / JCM 16511 / NBRC 101810 / Mat9-16) TaxID=945713 RepID=I0AFU1_IGNAJ|nr:DUF6588 family protein [Ignavibacterium album]AFH47848.1 Hypothetical protein IALB_0136 [Ignavibacterium album JCM 16511]